MIRNDKGNKKMSSYHAHRSACPDSVCVVTTSDGGVWNATSHHVRCVVKSQRSRRINPTLVKSAAILHAVVGPHENRGQLIMSQT